MSYNKENEYPIGVDEKDLNQEALRIIKSIRSLDSSNVRDAMNVIICKEKQQQIHTQMKRQEIANIEKITKTNPNLVSDIKNDIKENEISEEQANENRKDITMTTNKNIEDEREAM